MQTHILPITAGRPHLNFTAFRNFIAISAVDKIKIGYAFATLGGVEEFLQNAEGLENWKQAKKEIIIGLHHGITEPSALLLLKSLPRSITKVYLPKGRMEIAALSVPPLYHPKVIALEIAEQLAFLQVGSANLTAAAIGPVPNNYELSMAIEASGKESIPEADRFYDWWNSVRDSAIPIDNLMIERYGELRLKCFENNPILRGTIPTPSSIGNARHFFCEVGAASGPSDSRHQIEFPESLARFFGPLVRARRNLTLQKNNRTWEGRPLSYKITTFNVEIWRLGMPTIISGGEPVSHRAICFSRTTDSNTFEFQVADIGSRQYSKWLTAANQNGHIGATHGNRPRQYGFF